MASPDFDEIFGPGEFNEEEGTYRREFPGVEAGGTQNVLDFQVLKEHAERRNQEFTPLPNSNSKNAVIDKSGVTAEVENYSSGKSVLELDFDEDNNSVEGSMKSWVDQWLGEIIRREQKAYQAATRYVHDILPDKAEEKGLDESDVLEKELEFSGESLTGFHEAYREGWPHDLAVNYAMEFELWPFQDAEMDRSDLPGRMPIT
ncbi:MAG: hypothetical protein ABEK04_03585, partial [Candidatus Nanohalobium sp.]